MRRKKWIYPLIIVGFMLTNSCKKDDDKNNNTVTDINGNVYNTVTIGTQVWMSENLKVIHYRNGESIPNVTDTTQWSNLTTGAYCNYNNNANNATTYGRLYNWYAVNDSRNICPTGWHVPTNAEWTTLETYLGGSNVAGGKMKETGTTHWNNPNTDATNESGFLGLPGGDRDGNGAFFGIGYSGAWWSSTEESAVEAWYWFLGYNNAYLLNDSYFSTKIYGYSVRCVRN